MRIFSRFLIAISILFPPSSGFADNKPFKIGFISILTGTYSDVGQAMANAAILAVEDYRKDHQGEDVEIILEDDGADPKKALSAYQKLHSVDRADLIMPVSTFAIGALRDRVNKQKDLTFILGNEPYEPEDDYIYMFSPSGIPAERGLGEAVIKDYPSGNIIVVASQNEAFFRFARAVKEGTGGRAEILEIPSDADFKSLALSLRAKSPKAVVFNTLPADSARLIRELRRINLLPALYFDESIANSRGDIREILGDLKVISEAKILQLRSNMDPGFADRYTRRFNSPPQIWTDYAYDATYLALKLKGLSVEDARKWLASNIYHGVSGAIRFDNTGLRVAEYSVINLRDHPNFAGKLDE